MRPVYKCAEDVKAVAPQTALNLDQDYRCPSCGRLLMRGRVIQVETRCPRCKRLVDFRSFG